jgi:hypothetical protein
LFSSLRTVGGSIDLDFSYDGGGAAPGRFEVIGGFQVLEQATDISIHGPRFGALLTGFLAGGPGDLAAPSGTAPEAAAGGDLAGGPVDLRDVVVVVFAGHADW